GRSDAAKLAVAATLKKPPSVWRHCNGCCAITAPGPLQLKLLMHLAIPETARHDGTEIETVRMIQRLVEQHPRAEHAIVADFKRLYGVEGVGTHTAAVASGQLPRTWPVFRSTKIRWPTYASAATSYSAAAMTIISWWRSWSRGRF